jgi:hypothetical protein
MRPPFLLIPPRIARRELNLQLIKRSNRHFWRIRSWQIRAKPYAPRRDVEPGGVRLNAVFKVLQTPNNSAWLTSYLGGVLELCDDWEPNDQRGRVPALFVDLDIGILVYTPSCSVLAGSNRLARLLTAIRLRC